MRYYFLILLSCCLSFNLRAQDGEEVEFSVKRNIKTSQTYYYQSDTLNRRWQGQAIVTIEQNKDTLFYYSRFRAAQDSISGYHHIKLLYTKIGDTTFAHIFHRDSSSIKPMFVKNGILSNGYSPFASLLPPSQDVNCIMYYEGLQNITIGDSMYNCITLIEMTPFIDQGYRLKIKSTKLFKYRKQMFNTRVYCLREADYLPIKMFTGEPVKKYKQEGMPLYKKVSWQLVPIK